MRRLLLSSLVAAAALFAGRAPARADVTLPAVLGSHMVLQRDEPLPIWGWAAPHEEITIQLAEIKASAKADGQGNWKVTLPRMKADGKAHTLTVRGKNTIELEDILIGEVWIGSGQSNMEWSLRSILDTRDRSHPSALDARNAIAAANHPQLRMFHVPRVESKEPARDVKASWQVCTPESVARFSAVLYYFGLRLHQELKVPVGLINSSWGGSSIELWTVTERRSAEKYNGMIAPLMPLAIRGVTWYQGEADTFAKYGMKYRDKMEDLITGWRRRWGQNFPFLFVQLAPCAAYPPDALPAIWEAQAASLKIPGTGMVVTTDLVDDIQDIHPANKKDVGNRLALWALARVYDKKGIVYSGPLYKHGSLKVEGSAIRLSFAHVGGGLKSQDGKPLTEFQIAGADDHFVLADAVIDGETVVVRANGMEKPTQVRFGWRKIANPNLVNKRGLPASPFETNNWYGGTGE